MSNKRIFECIVVLILIFVASGFADQPVTSNVDKTIAKVNGKNIVFKEIKVDKAMIQFDPSLSDLEEDEIEIKKIKKENKKLLYKIRKTIIECNIEHFQLSVSDNEMEHELDKFFAKAGKAANSEKVVIEMKDKPTKIADVLCVWIEDPKKGELLYLQKLSSHLSQNNWKAYKGFYNTFQKIERMRKHIPNSLEDIRNSKKKSLKNDILTEKLKLLITEDITVNKNKTLEYYNNTYPKIIKWRIYHYIHINNEIIDEMIQSLKTNNKPDDIVNAYDLGKSMEGGYEIESFFAHEFFFPYYAQSLRNLKVGEVGEITYGPPEAQWRWARYVN